MAIATRIPTPSIVAFAAIAGLAIGFTGYALEGGWTADGAAAGARLTARFALVWFVAAWSASALARLWPGGWRTIALRRRRAIGLGFAAAHFVHFAALLIATLVFAQPSALEKVIGGGVGYVLVAAMAITSNDQSIRLLSPRNWKLLHATGGYIVAFIFAFAYWGRLENAPLLAGGALALLGAAAALRFAAWVKRRLPEARQAA
jgi:DMSO/TMAO reductase YedYZ heme-binding membrane subunit